MKAATPGVIWRTAANSAPCLVMVLQPATWTTCHSSIVCAGVMRPFIYLQRKRQSGNSRASIICCQWFSFVPKQDDLSALNHLEFIAKTNKKRRRQPASEMQTAEHCAESPLQSPGHLDMLLVVTVISRVELHEPTQTWGTECTPNLFLKFKKNKSFLPRPPSSCTSQPTHMDQVANGLVLHSGINAFRVQNQEILQKNSQTAYAWPLQLHVLAAQALQALFLVGVAGGSFWGPEAIILVCNFKMMLTFTTNTQKRLVPAFHNSRVPGKRCLSQTNGDPSSKRRRYSIV